MKRILPTFPFELEVDLTQGLADLEDFPVSKNLPEDIKKKQLETYRYVNATFPFYIPSGHHTMDFSKLESSKGEYWGDATHFLLCNKAHGLAMWRKLEEQIRSIDSTVSCRPHISIEMTNYILKHKKPPRIAVDVQEVFMAVQPIIVVQLPFQPVLLFQWLALTMHLMSLIEFHVDEFYSIPVRAEFEPHVMCLHNLLKSAQRNVGFLFDYLQHQVESEQEIFVGNLRLFERILGGIFPFLVFCLHYKGKNYIQSLKAECWKNWETRGKLFQLQKRRMPLKNRNFLFNPDLWRTPSPNLTTFGHSNERLVRAVRRRPKENEVFEIEGDVYDDLISTNDGFRKKVIGVNESISAWFNIDAGDRGILGTILHSTAGIELQAKIGKVKAFLQHKYKGHPPQDFEDVSEEFRVQEIESLILLLNSVHFHFQSTFDQLTETKEIAGSTNSLESQYEKRIRKIVIKCIGAHLRITNYEEQKDDVVRDWQVAQYLLPCFVALYRVILMPAKESQNDLTVWYATFLDKLIGTYEDKNLGFRKSSWKNILEDIEATPALRESYYEKNHQNLLSFFKRVSEDFYERTKICPTAFGHLAHCGYFRAFYEVLEKSCGENKTPSNDIATEPCVYWNWLMWDFFGRMERAMKEASEFE
ncbi:Hypothetical predicted protein [Cloeon dipterum]|uniref:Uncharacterized protein n=1 Tax=Cloeon dipterum TaxID=197152 RepID=A0A8S1DRV2_9INSE|nr:Hypothetical predicted protein [Cloeon dipterum]